jgi:hypothetical protein
MSVVPHLCLSLGDRTCGDAEEGLCRGERLCLCEGDWWNLNGAGCEDREEWLRGESTRISRGNRVRGSRDNDKVVIFLSISSWIRCRDSSWQVSIGDISDELLVLSKGIGRWFAYLAEDVSSPRGLRLRQSIDQATNAAG